MTRKQRQLLKLIHEALKADGGVCPSYEEMQKAVGLKSKSGINRLVVALDRSGMIDRAPNRARTITVTERGVRALEGAPCGTYEPRIPASQIASYLRERSHRYRFYGAAEALEEVACEIEEGRLA